MGFRQSHSYCHGDPLSQGACGRFYPKVRVVFRMASCLAAPLAKIPKVIYADVVSGQMKQRVKQLASMTSGEDKTVAIEPPRVCGIMSQKPVPQSVGHRGGPERQSGVTRVGFLAHVDRENPDCIDAKLIEIMAKCLIHSAAPLLLLISVIAPV
jgi:hypothetical protein